MDFGAKGLANVRRRRCVNTQAFSFCTMCGARVVNNILDENLWLPLSIYEAIPILCCVSHYLSIGKKLSVSQEQKKNWNGLILE